MSITDRLLAFRYTTSSRDIPWDYMHNVDVEGHRVRDPDLHMLKNLVSLISDCNLVGAASQTTASTDLQHLLSVLQLSLQFTLWSQSILREQTLLAQHVKLSHVEGLEREVKKLREEVVGLREERDKFQALCRVHERHLDKAESMIRRLQKELVRETATKTLTERRTTRGDAMDCRLRRAEALLEQAELRVGSFSALLEEERALALQNAKDFFDQLAVKAKLALDSQLGTLLRRLRAECTAHEKPHVPASTPSALARDVPEEKLCARCRQCLASTVPGTCGGEAEEFGQSAVACFSARGSRGVVALHETATTGDQSLLSPSSPGS